MRLRKQALTDPAASFLLPIFERLVWSPSASSGDERLAPDLRQHVATAPAGTDALLARALDATPRWRLAGDAEAALSIRLLSARQSREGLPSVLRAACDLDADDADAAVGCALHDAIKDYSSVAMDEMVSFAAERHGDRGVLPSFLLATGGAGAVELAMTFLRPEVLGELSTRTWHLRLVATLATCGVQRVLPLLAAAIERVPRDEGRWVDGDQDWARAVVGLAVAVARLGGQLSPAERRVVEEAEAVDERRQRRLEALAVGAYARELAAASASTPRVKLDALAGDPLPLVRAAAASNPHTPPDVLGRLAGDVSPEVRCATAANARTPEEAQEQLARDPEVDVRRALALCGDLYPGVIELLIRDPDSEVREQVVPALPATLLHHAARDLDPDVRQAVPWNPRVPEELLDQLAADPDPNVRAAVAAVRAAASPSTPAYPQPNPV